MAELDEGPDEVHAQSDTGAHCCVSMGPRRAAAAAGVGHDVIYDAIRDGLLAARRLGRRTLIMREDLENWVRSLPAVELAQKPAEARRGYGAAPRRRERTGVAPQQVKGAKPAAQHAGA